MTVKTETLLDAAARTLARRPDASLQQIAAAAGVSRTTIFYRFATRDLLLEALALDTLTRLEGTLRSLEWDVESPEGAARNAATALMPLAPRMQVSLREAPNDMSPTVADRWVSAMSPLTDYVEICQRKGILRPDHPATWLTWSLIYLMFAAWDAVSSGELGSVPAARMVAQSWVSGAAVSRGNP